MAAKHPVQLYREANNLTQEEFGKKVGVKAPTVSRWEQRLRTPRGKKLERTCKITGISVAEMLGLQVAQ